MLDTLIRQIKIIDGTGQAAYYGNVGIKSRTLCLPCPETEAAHTIDGRGLTLSPGFIDSHSHSDLCLGADPSVAFIGKISQGITSEVTGQCGVSLFPSRKSHLEELQNTVLGSLAGQTARSMTARFTSFERFLNFADSVPKTANYAFLVGHSTLRTAVMGTENRKATPKELQAMKALLKEAMEHGAKGLSSGLVYIPGAYADREELTELCRVIEPYHGIYATHMRNEAELVNEAVAEAISTAEASGVSLVISHHKICGKQNWGASARTLEQIHKANERGVRVNLDMYPYHATQTTLTNCMHPDYFSESTDTLLARLDSGSFRREVMETMQAFPPSYDNPYINAGGFDGILISSAPNTPDAVGRTIASYAAMRAEEPFDTFFYLLRQNRLLVNATYFSLNEEEMLQIYRDPYTMIGTDAICSETPGPVHPRAYGSFVKPLADFALKRRLLPLEDAVRKQTGLTAAVWGLSKKGAVLDGFDADLVLFDESSLQDTATFENGARAARGIRFVFVGGAVIYENGRLTEARPGSCLPA